MGIMLFLVVLVMGTYMLNPVPEESPLAGIMILSSVAILLLLLFTLAGMVVKDGEFSAH